MNGMNGNGDAKIWRTDRYEDAEGRVVIQRNPLKPGAAEYVGSGMVVLAYPEGKRNESIVFPIEADGVRAAFEAWGEAYKRAVEAFKADLNRPRIVVPG